jgi:hypothetical protein
MPQGQAAKDILDRSGERFRAGSSQAEVVIWLMEGCRPDTGEHCPFDSALQSSLVGDSENHQVTGLWGILCSSAGCSASCGRTKYPQRGSKHCMSGWASI